MKRGRKQEFSLDLDEYDQFVINPPTEKEKMIKLMEQGKWLDPLLVSYYLNPESITGELTPVFLFITAMADKKNLFHLLKARNEKYNNLTQDMIVNNPAHGAILLQDIELLDFFIKDRRNEVDEQGLTPLTLAIKNGLYNTTRYLLDLDSKLRNDFNGNTALHLAVYSGTLKLVKLVNDEFQKNNDGDDPLQLAVKMDFLEIAEYLIDKIDDKRNLIKYAINNRNPLMLKLLKSRGVETSPDDIELELVNFRRLRDEVAHQEIMSLL